MKELDELIDALDMSSYLDHQGIDYRHRHGSSGPQLNVKVCPSCGNSNWKVYISEYTGLGNCFAGSCEMKTFNKWKFIKVCVDGTNKQVFEHIKSISSQLGWRPKQKAKPTQYTSELVLPDSIELPDTNGDVPQYLLQRGVTAEMCKYFQLKYCHEGIFRYKDQFGDKKQNYSGRIVIPIFGMRGELVSFQGRDITGTSDKKYIFPPGYASSGAYLYNGHNAYEAKRLVIGEGVFDVMAIKSALDMEYETRDVATVGTFGMHLSSGANGNSQLAKLVELRRAGLEQVVFMWDGERNAIKAALDASVEVRSIGLTTRIALLPEGKDPNEVDRQTVIRAFSSAVDPNKTDGMKKILNRLI
jgi:DNA primase